MIFSLYCNVLGLGRSRIEPSVSKYEMKDLLTSFLLRFAFVLRQDQKKIERAPFFLDESWHFLLLHAMLVKAKEVELNEDT